MTYSPINSKIILKDIDVERIKKEIFELKNCFSVISGYQMTKKVAKTMIVISEFPIPGEKIFFGTPKDISNGSIFPETEIFEENPHRFIKYYVEENDILMVAKAGGEIKFAIVPKLTQKYLISSMLYIIRTRKNSPISPEFLFAYLQSPDGLRQLKKINYSKNPNLFNFKKVDLENLQIPMNTGISNEILLKLKKSREKLTNAKLEYENILSEIKNYWK